MPTLARFTPWVLALLLLAPVGVDEAELAIRAVLGQPGLEPMDDGFEDLHPGPVPTALNGHKKQRHGL